jgi:hypothetical protein
MDDAELERAGRDLDQHHARLRHLLDRRFGHLPERERRAAECRCVDALRTPLAQNGLVFQVLMSGWLPSSLWCAAEHNAAENAKREALDRELNAARTKAAKPQPKRSLPLPPERPMTVAQVCKLAGVDLAPYAHLSTQQAVDSIHRQRCCEDEATQLFSHRPDEC